MDYFFSPEDNTVMRVPVCTEGTCENSCSGSCAGDCVALCMSNCSLNCTAWYSKGWG